MPSHTGQGGAFLGGSCPVSLWAVSGSEHIGNRAQPSPLCEAIRAPQFSLGRKQLVRAVSKSGPGCLLRVLVELSVRSCSTGWVQNFRIPTRKYHNPMRPTPYELRRSFLVICHMAHFGAVIRRFAANGALKAKGSASTRPTSGTREPAEKISLRPIGVCFDWDSSIAMAMACLDTNFNKNIRAA